MRKLKGIGDMTSLKYLCLLLLVGLACRANAKSVSENFNYINQILDALNDQDECKLPSFHDIDALQGSYDELSQSLGPELEAKLNADQRLLREHILDQWDSFQKSMRSAVVIRSAKRRSFISRIERYQDAKFGRSICTSFKDIVGPSTDVIFEKNAIVRYVKLLQAHSVPEPPREWISGDVAFPEPSQGSSVEKKSQTESAAAPHELRLTPEETIKTAAHSGAVDLNLSEGESESKPAISGSSGQIGGGRDEATPSGETSSSSGAENQFAAAEASPSHQSEHQETDGSDDDDAHSQDSSSVRFSKALSESQASNEQKQLPSERLHRDSITINVSPSQLNVEHVAAGDELAGVVRNKIGKIHVDFGHKAAHHSDAHPKRIVISFADDQREEKEEEEEHDSLVEIPEPEKATDVVAQETSQQETAVSEESAPEEMGAEPEAAQKVDESPKSHSVAAEDPPAPAEAKAPEPEPAAAEKTDDFDIRSIVGVIFVDPLEESYNIRRLAQLPPSDGIFERAYGAFKFPDEDPSGKYYEPKDSVDEDWKQLLADPRGYDKQLDQKNKKNSAGERKSKSHSGFGASTFGFNGANLNYDGPDRWIQVADNNVCRIQYNRDNFIVRKTRTTTIKVKDFISTTVLSGGKKSRML